MYMSGETVPPTPTPTPLINEKESSLCNQDSLKWRGPRIKLIDRVGGILEKILFMVKNKIIVNFAY